MHEWRLNGDGVMNMDSIDGSPYLTVKIHICLTPLMGTIQLRSGLVSPPKVYIISHRIFGHMYKVLNID